MKTRLLITIGIFVVIGSITTILTMNFLDDKKTMIFDNTPEQLRAVLNYCNDLDVYVANTRTAYSNGTHYIDNFSCKWVVEFSWHDEYARDAIDNIRIHGNNDNGATPSILKYCLSGGTSDGFTINNSTHYFDFETCKWENHPLKIQVCRGDCVDSPSLDFDQSTPVIITVCENEHDVPCIDLVDVVFGGIDWVVYPGGVGPVPLENFTLTKIYKGGGFGMPTLDFEAMLDDKTFANKCESNGGIWNYTYHDCEGIWEICQDVNGVKITRDITKPCTEGVCLDGTIYRMSCVFEYEK
jgi:hypothetical protein